MVDTRGWRSFEQELSCPMLFVAVASLFLYGYVGMSDEEGGVNQMFHIVLFGKDN